MAWGWSGWRWPSGLLHGSSTLPSLRVLTAVKARRNRNRCLCSARRLRSQQLGNRPPPRGWDESTPSPEQPAGWAFPCSVSEFRLCTCRPLSILGRFMLSFRAQKPPQSAGVRLQQRRRAVSTGLVSLRSHAAPRPAAARWVGLRRPWVRRQGGPSANCLATHSP
jgi:hypothetical protein